MIYAIVIIYNKPCSESETLSVLKLYREKLNIVIFDNGSEKYNNEQYCHEYGLTYLSYNNNMGISKAYNRAIINLQVKESDYVFIFDDDTILTKEYMEEALNLIKDNECDICLPIVMANHIILSPSNKKFKCGSKIVSNIEDIKINKITAINSGMIVSGKVYQKIEYDENLFLDMVDHRFMDCVRDAGYKIFIMKSIIYQNYSRQEKNNYESAWSRYQIFKKDFKTYCVINNAKTFYLLSILKLKFFNAFKYRKIGFLIK